MRLEIEGAQFKIILYDKCGNFEGFGMSVYAIWRKTVIFDTTKTSTNSNCASVLSLLQNPVFFSTSVFAFTKKQ